RGVRDDGSRHSAKSRARREGVTMSPQMNAQRSPRSIARRRPVPAQQPVLVQKPAVRVETRQRSIARPASVYALQDLHAIAQIAYHYLFSGGVQIALTLFE